MRKGRVRKCGHIGKNATVDTFITNTFIPIYKKYEREGRPRGIMREIKKEVDDKLDLVFIDNRMNGFDNMFDYYSDDIVTIIYDKLGEDELLVSMQKFSKDVSAIKLAQ